MKKTLITFILLTFMICVFSCKKENDRANDFYNTHYRAGLWISLDKADTLDFINGKNLVRKHYGYEEYLYRINGGNLFIRLPNSTEETQHPILKVEKDSVVLGNMYITNGFTDNSETFIKEIKN
ncbi:hypothetical protein [Pedobacter arcticus]|uniref:hypothetical protein n=1 Tax=Pedobacter arcticus TaxID=752140 RepID=UPI00037068FB|nr:hypothetical protein [Pedobacter arcticus]